MSDILREWDAMRSVLAKAIDIDPNHDEAGVFDALMSGQMGAIKAFEGASGYIVMSRTQGEDGQALFVNYLGGSIEGGPKQRLGVIRAFAAAIEQQAIRMGCNEILGGGRGWHRFLPDWEATPRPSGGYSLRKAL